MNAKKFIIVIVLVVILSLSLGYERGWAQGKEEIGPARIGIVSVQQLLAKSKDNARWEEQIMEEQAQVRAQFEQISADIKALDEDMKTRKFGSEDYFKLEREIIEKQTALKAKDAFYQEDFDRRQRRWIENLFQKILSVSADVAQKKGLDMVLAKEEFDFPSRSASDLLLTIKTGKVLYHNPKLDITDEVLTALDNQGSK